jgi:hypothetical protein
MSLIVGGIALAFLILGKIFLKHKPVALFVVMAGSSPHRRFRSRQTA